MTETPKTPKGLSLSHLCELVGNDVIEVHPLHQCLNNARAGTGKDKGWTKLTLTVWTRCVTPGDFARSEQPYRGMVIFMPTDKVEAALKAHEEGR